MGRRLIGARATILVAMCLGPAGAVSAGPVPSLRGHHAYSGSYVKDGSPEGLGFEVEQQQGRWLVQVSIDAQNEAQLHGQGHIARNHVAFTVNTHTPGPIKTRHHLNLDGTVVDGGQALQGNYELTRPGLATLTGTFSVSR